MNEINRMKLEEVAGGYQKFEEPGFFVKRKIPNILAAIRLPVFAAAALVLAACSDRRPAEPDILAAVGDRRIDWQHLQRSYELNPKWGRGLTRQEAYNHQLEYLVHEKLFALAAREQGLDREPDMAAYLQFIREKEMIKALQKYF